MAADNEFGRRVRALRSAAGLTQAELAEASGISERTVSDLERGLRTSVYPATARRLASALGVQESERPAFMLAASGSPAEFPMSNSSSIPVSSIPTRLTRLVGRDRELAALLHLLDDADARLVTIAGPGGVGKTRLAIEAAAVLESHTVTHFISLSGVDDPALVLPALATRVGLQPTGADLVPLLARRLGGAPTLLVLDTFEHLLDAAVAVADLVAACPAITALVTSRTALNVRGEREVPLAPLEVEPGVALFVERATAVSPAFSDSVSPTVSDAEEVLAAVAEICARLDGLPLAIELAAARVKHMPLADLRQNLDHRLDRLVGGARDLPPRHQTMRAAIDWSYALLGGPELRLLRALSVFRGSFDRDALAAVGSLDDDLDASLSALVNANLVVVEAGVSGRARYRLLDLVREYALERAEAAGDVAVLRRRHLAHYLELAEQAEPELRGAAQRHWHTRLVQDQANFRAALGFAIDSGEGDLALRLAGALWMSWRWAGLFREGRTWLDAALETGAAGARPALLQALWGAGWLAFHQGDYARTDEVGRQMLALLGDAHEPVGDAADSPGDVTDPSGDAADPLSRRHALTLVGNAALAERRLPEAIAALTRALEACEAAGSRWHLGTSLLNLGSAHLAAGNRTLSRDLYRRALAIYEDLGDQHFTARVLIQLGYADLAEGLPASTPILRAMRIAAQLGDGWSIAEGLEAVACLLAADPAGADPAGADPASAVVLAAAADRLRDQISMRPHPPDAVINQRHLAAARDRLGSAAFDEAWARGRALSLAAAIDLAIPAGQTR